MAAIFAVALVARLVGMITAHAVARLASSPDNWVWGYEAGRIARSLAMGRGFSSPYTTPTGPTALLAPGFPALLGVVFRIFGIYSRRSAFVILGFNVLASALSSVLVYLIGRKVFGAGAGRLAGWISVFSLTSIEFCRGVWDTTLFTFLFSLLILATFYLEEQPNYLRWWLGYGLLWGAVALMSPSCLSALPVLFGWLWWRSRQRGARVTLRIGAAVVIFFVTVTPWLVRNYRTFNEFVFLRSGFGLELYIGNNPVAVSRWSAKAMELHPSNNEDEMRRYADIGEVSYMKEKQREAIDFITRHKLIFVTASFRRFLSWWLDLTYGTPLHWFTALTRLVFSPILSLLTFLGLGLAFHKRESKALALAGVLVVFPIVYCVTHINLRYRQPIEPIMIVFAAYALVELVRYVASATNRQRSYLARGVETLS